MITSTAPYEVTWEKLPDDFVNENGSGQNGYLRAAGMEPED